jgi:RNA polymerase sigma-70 factor, ECF subfamily
MTESELILELKNANRAAFVGLVTMHQTKVINICYRFLLNRQDAEDVAQEVFIEVFHSIHKFKADSKLSTWIYRIAATKSLDEIKKQNRKKRISSIGKTLGLDLIANWLADTDRPDTTLENNEDYALLLAALNKLPESQRIALTLSKIEDYSNTEIAETMQTTLTAVDALIYRAKQNLKTYLRQNENL